MAKKKVLKKVRMKEVRNLIKGSGPEALIRVSLKDAEGYGHEAFVTSASMTGWDAEEKAPVLELDAEVHFE